MADRRQKVQSVEVGMDLLIALSELGAEVSLSRLAQSAQMLPSKAHRYLKALVASGLAAQDEATGLYRLGPRALSIGFAAIGNLDVVAMSGTPLASLRDQLNETCILSVWANMGPTVVRIEPAMRAVVVNVRIGSVLPMLVSATGIAFAAFLDDQQVRDMIAAERRGYSRKGERDLIKRGETSIAEARERGFARVNSTLTPGVSAVAAPLFDYQRKVAGVVAVLGPTDYFDGSADGTIVRELLAATSAISDRLGSPKAPASPRLVKKGSRQR